MQDQQCFASITMNETEYGRPRFQWKDITVRLGLILPLSSNCLSYLEGYRIMMTLTSKALAQIFQGLSIDRVYFNSRDSSPLCILNDECGTWKVLLLLLRASLFSRSEDSYCGPEILFSQLKRKPEPIFNEGDTVFGKKELHRYWGTD